MRLPIRLVELPKCLLDQLMCHPNTWIAALLGVPHQAIEQWRLRHGYKPATGRGGAHRKGREEFLETWKGLVK